MWYKNFVRWLKQLRKKEISLGDLDKTPIKNIGIKNIEKPYRFKFENKITVKSCSSCGERDFKKVKPQMSMGERVLFECTNCHERIWVLTGR